MLKDRYEPLETVGTGGEARVIKALDRQHGRTVALKVRTVSDRREDLLREARVLFGLTPHPSLPLVREDFFEAGLYVVVMDWVDGIDLAKLLRERGAPGLPAPSVLAYLADAAEALTFLHTHTPAIIHGDVKPANLILTRGGHVKLVDFGLSSRLGMEGMRRGTSGFRAPELDAGGAPSRASDVYALAATAFALFAGGPPAGVAPRLARIEGPHAEHLEETITAGLATDPARRPRTPGELVERLRSGWASTLPTGVMTFCMSDIEDSTRLWESQPTVMAEALARHDELIAGIVEAHEGRFLKSMGEGDSTTSVFASAAQGVRAAIEATRALAEQTSPEDRPIRTRFALHTGEADKHGDVYVGTTVNLAARVRGQAEGGEVLLSETTAQMVSADLPAGYEIIDLGSHRLKGIKQQQVIKAVTGPGLATTATATDCPYRGLLPFEPEDRHLFFGREVALERLLARITPGRLLAVVGASGSGKSSLLRAGVVAGVESGELPPIGAARLITPGPVPPLDLRGAADQLLVVDQFEELYTQCRDAERQQRFVEELLSREGPVVIGVRADFYAEISADAQLAAAVAANQLLLGPMDDEDLRRAICEPARLMGLRLEPGLVDLVLRDVGDEPGALPLMSHALRETWERRDGRTLTVDAYKQSGGVSSAVAQTADAVAESTPEEDRTLLRSVFLRLTEVGGEVEDSRRKVRVEELIPEGRSPDAVKSLLERLVEARLITLDAGTAEVAHEVLIRRWPRLRRWLEEDREGIRLHRRLGDAARLWDAAGREPADLYRGTRLDAALEWARANPGLLNATERDFLNSSAEESVRAQRVQLKANRRLRRALGGAACLLAATIALLVFALVSRHDAVRTEAAARSQAMAGEAEGQIARDPQRALLLARVALKAAPTPAAMLAASEALDANTVRSQLPSFGVQGCAISNYMYLLDRGREAVDNACDGHVVFGDLVHRRILDKVRVGASSTDVVPSPDGRSLIVAAGRDLVSVDLATDRVRHLFTAPFPIVWIGHDQVGRFMAIGDADTIGIADLRSGRLRVIAHGDASANSILGMLWTSPDVLLIETSGQSRGRGDLFGGLTTLDVVSGKRRNVPLAVPVGRFPALAFLNISPDRRTWFITGADTNTGNVAQVATTWAVDAATGRAKWIAHGPIGASANSVQPSDDGRLLGVGYSEGSIDVLDATTGRRVVRDASSASIAAGWMAFPPGDKSLVTVSLDGVFRTWAATGSELLRWQAPADPAVDFTPDGRNLVVVGNEGEVVDGRSGAPLRRFRGFPAASVFNLCTAACFAASPSLGWLTYVDPSASSPRIVELAGRTGRRAAEVSVSRLDAEGVAPDGRIVAAYVDGNRLLAEVIDPRSGKTRHLQPGVSSYGCAATAPSFTPDGTLMAIVDGCVHVDVWDLRTGSIKRTVVLPDRANASSGAGGGSTASGAHLSPDGRYVLVTVEGGGLVRVNLSTGAFAERPGAQTVAKTLAVSPDGRFYAIGRQDGTVDEYDANSLQLVRHHELDNPIQTLTFSPDGRELAVEDTSNVVWIWDTCEICENAKRLSQLAAQESVRQLTPSERATFGIS